MKKISIKNQNLIGNNGDYGNHVLENCKVIGNNNKIETMIGGQIIGNGNEVVYASDVSNIGNNNKYLNTFDLESEKEIENIEDSNLPEEIRSALNLKTKYDAHIKRTQDGLKELEKEKQEHYKKYGTLWEKSKSYLEGFYKK